MLLTQLESKELGLKLRPSSPEFMLLISDTQKSAQLKHAYVVCHRRKEKLETDIMGMFDLLASSVRDCQSSAFNNSFTFRASQESSSEVSVLCWFCSSRNEAKKDQ